MNSIIVRVGQTITVFQDREVFDCKIENIYNFGMFLSSDKPLKCKVGDEIVPLKRFWLRGTAVVREPANDIRTLAFDWFDEVEGELK